MQSRLIRNGPDLAEQIIDQVGIPSILKCLNEPKTSLKRIAVNCLNQIVKHNDDLARRVISDNEKLIDNLENCLFQSEDILLRRQTLICLANIAKHKRTLAEKIIEKVEFSRVLPILHENDLIVKVSVFAN